MDESSKTIQTFTIQEILEREIKIVEKSNCDYSENSLLNRECSTLPCMYSGRLSKLERECATLPCMYAPPQKRIALNNNPY